MSQAASQAAAFYRDAAKARSVWTLRDDDGYPAPKNGEGVRAQPFWSSRARAEKIAPTVPAYAGFEVTEIPLDTFVDKWLPSLEESNLRVGVNWSGPHATGYDIEPRSVRASLEFALKA